MQRFSDLIAVLVVLLIQPGVFASQVKSNRTAPLRHFSVQMSISTSEYQKTAEAILSLAAKHKSYFYRSTESFLGLRVPNKTLHTFLKEVETLAELTQKSIDSQDLTSKRVRQIAIIKSRTKMQQDYLNIIAQSANRNELVEAESATRRIITELENAKGQLRKIEQNIRYGKLDIHFKTPVKLTISSGKRSPFPWINTVSVTNTLQDFNLN